jgi:hypothetical protein
VRLIEHHHAVALQVRVGQVLAKKHAVRHVLDDRLRAWHVLEPQCTPPASHSQAIGYTQVSTMHRYNV